MGFEREEYERLVLDWGERVALEAAMDDVERLEAYMSSHYTSAVLVAEISTLRFALRRCLLALKEGAQAPADRWKTAVDAARKAL